MFPGWRRPIELLSSSIVLALAGAGCVERLLQIRSEPSGAEVYVNGERAGVTPLDHRFDFYGTFDITLRSRGRLSVHRLEPVHPPWYELPPLDFIAENVVPFRIHDRHELSYALEPVPTLGDVDPRRETEKQDLEKETVKRKIEALEAK